MSIETESSEPTPYASPTPATTGMRDIFLYQLHLAPKRIPEKKIVKMGVAARTTWWN